ncbi:MULTISPECIES: ferrochelatase [Nonomuraea]|uniref:Coproporphyrin III ferrochelatase n=1 Tax=Nonomuraea guangzhouensis TaxID=1291555 RepID=A0ABW4G6S4_9ACTN|nr:MULTISPECIES: ferrochelatase [Nonomuraea]MBT2226987.1 ferrochelatase [Nonomuraea sp. NEAU-A123]
MGTYDALLVLSFGGPEGPDDVLPFLENVVRGRGVPRERLLQVAEHYQGFGGVSPINGQNRELIEALRPVVGVPVYWGNRNWHPFGEETVLRMKDDGVRKAAVFATSAFAGYSSCRQYYEDIARISVKGGPELVKMRHFGEHPGFVAAMADHVRQALDRLGRDDARLVFTAHSVPVSMARTAGPYGGLYEAQLRRSAELVNAALGRTQPWDLVWQSRSGPPEVPWLEPDVCDHLRKTDARSVVLVPIGFVSDHMEVVYDLDTEARQVATELGLPMERAATAGVHPAFVRMVRELMDEPEPQPCALTCCPPPRRRQV